MKRAPRTLQTFVTLAALTWSASLSAQVPTPSAGPAPPAAPSAPFPEGVSVGAGLTQPLVLRGANAAVTVRRGRLVADVSHGVALDLNASGGAGLTDAEADGGLDVDVPWTTGFGVGYRITPRLDIRIEPKAHRFRVTTPGGDTFAYTAFSVGPGVYYRLPIWRGLEVEPSVRFWPNVADTLAPAEAEYLGADGAPRTHEAHDFGLFVNASLGWQF